MTWICKLSLLAFIPVVVTAMLMASPALAEEKPDDGDNQPTLEEKVEILTEEVSRLREQMNLPETDKELASAYGMGPAASKVYSVSRGVSVGGYGEFYFAAPYGNTAETGLVNTTDFYRFIAYVGYKFSRSIIMNAEIEYEHATTEANYQGKSGEVSVEFAYLDFLINPAFNIRGGNVLVPMGFINLMHEPTTYWGNFRPFVEQSIIPTTWREMGLGAHGDAWHLSYSVYALNGFNASHFDDAGVREGRQMANRAIWEDVGGVASLDLTGEAGGGGQLRVGGSAFAGGADQNLIPDPNGGLLSVTNQIVEGHAEIRVRGLRARALLAASHISNAAALSEALFADTTGQVSEQVPENQIGWYVEAGYDVAQLLSPGAAVTLTPWVRYERFNLQSKVGAATGLPADPALDGALLTFGLESQPHPNVVIKLDLVHPTNESGEPVSDEIRLGAGFVY